MPFVKRPTPDMSALRALIDTRNQRADASEDDIQREIDRLRSEGASWRDIGKVLMLTHEGARYRYG